jgi:hypothetical protein
MDAAMLTEYLPAQPVSRNVSPDDAVRSELVRSIEDTFTALIKDRASVSVAIDALLDSSEVREAFRRFHKVHGVPPWKRIKAENRFQPAVFLDPELSTLLRKAVRIANETSAAVAGGVRDFPTTVPAAEQDVNPLWFFDDPTLPQTYVDGFLAVRRAELENVLLREMTWPLIKNIGIVRELARLWVRDMETYAVFVASCQEARVSSKIVPLEERHDLDAERERRRKALDVLAKL